MQKLLAWNQRTLIIGAMTKNDLITHFGSQSAYAAQVVARYPDFPLTQAAVSQWADDGVPPLRQLQAEHMTDGVLRADAWIPRGREAQA